MVAEKVFYGINMPNSEDFTTAGEVTKYQIRIFERRTDEEVFDPKSTTYPKGLPWACMLDATLSPKWYQEKVLDQSCCSSS